MVCHVYPNGYPDVYAYVYPMGPVPNNHSGQNVQEDMPLEGACPWPTVARFKNKPPWK